MALAMLSACSTKKNTFVSRNYHNLTARYNGYFNAKESVKEGVALLEKAHKDDYTGILEIYNDGSPQEAAAAYPQMEKAVKKCSHVIQRHSIYVSKEEHCKWIDDSYLLIGIAQFYKQDFLTALRTFDYVAKEYSSEPIHYDALLWMIRANAELGQFADALVLIDLVNNDKQFPKSLRGRYETIYADFYLKQHDYIDAAVHLRKAVSMTKKRKRRTRLMFILAQLYQRAGDYRKAGDLYAQVIKLNPPYEMAFYAKINRARTFGVEKDKVSASSGKEIRKQLEKMLRDDKNTDYFDQILYTLAEMDLREGREEEALTRLEQSVRSSTTNTHQKGLSYLLTADIRFRQKSYETAQAYYDSSVTALSQDYEGYEAAMNKRNSLGGLVKNLRTIEVEDSLQRIAKMPERERSDFIDALIEKAVRDEERRRQEEEDRARRAQELVVQGAISQRTGAQNQPAGAGGWYFYNPTTLQSGMAEFRTRWGERPIEDNWRRSGKNTFAGFAGEGAGPDTLAEGRSLTPSNIRDKNAYLANLPLNQETMRKSDERIIEAWYQLGIIYKERLEDGEQAIHAFTSLIGRYPKNRHRAPSCYYLYLLHQSAGNDAEADKYRNIILTEFRSSEYAQLITNPNYLEEKRASSRQAEEFYEATFLAYNNSDWQTVIGNYRVADSVYGGSPLMPKFTFLHAMSLGRTGQDSAFVAGLEHIASGYSYDAVGDAARAMLEMMRRTTAAPDTAAADSAAAGPAFTKTPGEAHIYVAILPNGSDMDAFRKKVSDFNALNFGTDKLSVSAMLLDKDRQLAVVRDFRNGDRAMDYYTAIQTNNDVYGGMDMDRTGQFVISASNYALFYQAKAVKAYLRFFFENYSQPGKTR